MKKNKFLIALALVNLTAKSQSYTLFPGPVVSDTSFANGSSELEIRFLNTSSQAINLQYEKINATYEIGWRFDLYDYQSHFLYLIPGRVMDPIPPGAYGFLRIEYDFRGIAGTGQTIFKIWDTANPSQVNFLTYNFVVIPDTSSGIAVDSEMLQQQLSVFPNPASDQFILHSTTGKLPAGKIQLFAMDGKQVLNTEIKEQNDLSIPVRDLAPGLFFLHFISSEGDFRTRLIIE